MTETCTLYDVIAGRCRAGCGKPARTAGRCWGHHSRVRRLTAPRCRLDGCDGPAEHRTGLCARHERRRRLHGDPTVTVTPKPVVRYSQAHNRVARQRGRASDYACVDCGKPAQDWSYEEPGDPGRIVNGRRRYSLDVALYTPRCRSCHMTLDQRRRKRREAV